MMRTPKSVQQQQLHTSCTPCTYGTVASLQFLKHHMAEQVDDDSPSRASKRCKREETLAGLPVECVQDDGSGEKHADATLRLGWSDWAESRDSLVNEALRPLLAVGVEFDAERGYDLLMRFGAADSDHFLPEDERLEDEEPNGFCDNGWNVRILLVKVTHSEALQLVDKLVARLVEDYDDYNGSALDVSALPADASSLRQRARLLLNNHAQRSSIRYARCEHKERHTDYPSRDVQDSLMWLTSDNRRMELTGSFSYQIC